MRLVEFERILRKEGAYRTPATARGCLPVRLIGKLDSSYYLRICGVVVRAGLRAMFMGYGRGEWIKSAFRMLRIVETSGGTVEVAGMGNITALEGPVVYVANHMSMIETLVLPGALIAPFQDVAVVVKESLLHYAFFGAVMRSIDPIAVGRKNARRDLMTVLKDGERKLRLGRSVLIFPQSTRIAGFSRDDFNTLGVKLAERAGVRVVPVALKTDFHGLGKRVKDIGKLDRGKTLHFRFGEPVTVENREREAHEDVIEFITASLAEWS